MIELSTSGTLGDTYINVVKLYKLAQTEKIKVRHYTLHPNWHDKIREIYSLLPNVEVDFVTSRDMDHPRIGSDFAFQDEYALEIEPFPHFDFGSPCLYMKNRIVISPISGKDNEERKMSQRNINEIHEKIKNHGVVIGSEENYFIPHDWIDTRGRTTLLASFDVVAYAEGFYGFQGLHCFFALSQKVPTTIYYKYLHEKTAVEIRMLPEWKEYLIEMVQV